MLKPVIKKNTTVLAPVTSVSAPPIKNYYRLSADSKKLLGLPPTSRHVEYEATTYPAPRLRPCNTSTTTFLGPVEVKQTLDERPMIMDVFEEKGLPLPRSTVSA